MREFHSKREKNPQQFNDAEELQIIKQICQNTKEMRDYTLESCAQ